MEQYTTQQSSNLSCPIKHPSTSCPHHPLVGLEHVPSGTRSSLLHVGAIGVHEGRPVELKDDAWPGVSCLVCLALLSGFYPHVLEVIGSGCTCWR
jgi:hypothetical protein